MQDSAIIELYFSRSEQALSETQTKYGAYCTSIAYNILGSPEDAEECVNDTYLRVWNSIPPKRPERFSAYIGRITRNLALNRLESQSRNKRGSGQATIALCELDELLPDNDSLDNDMSDGEISSAIDCFLRTQNRLTQLAFVGRYFRFESEKEIASHLGISVNHVKVLLHRARAGLKKHLEKEGIPL